jgi:hypothetical protein
MPLFGTDNKGNSFPVPFRVSPAADHRVVYANGAIGAPYMNYHYRLDFYQDEMPVLTFLDAEGDGKPAAERLKEGIERKVVVSLILSMPFAKELAIFLDKGLKEYEVMYGEIQLPKSNMPEEMIAALQEKKHELETKNPPGGGSQHKSKRSRDS